MAESLAKLKMLSLFAYFYSVKIVYINFFFLLISEYMKYFVQIAFTKRNRYLRLIVRVMTDFTPIKHAPYALPNKSQRSYKIQNFDQCHNMSSHTHTHTHTHVPIMDIRIWYRN